MGYRLYPRVEAANDGHEPVTKFHTITLSLASGTDVGRAERICFGWPDGLGKRLRVCYRSRLGEEEGSRLQAPGSRVAELLSAKSRGLGEEEESARYPPLSRLPETTRVH